MIAFIQAVLVVCLVIGIWVAIPIFAGIAGTGLALIFIYLAIKENHNDNTNSGTGPGNNP
jgi:hypothetical protein